MKKLSLCFEELENLKSFGEWVNTNRLNGTNTAIDDTFEVDGGIAIVGNVENGWAYLQLK